jgi:hypothetical protein
MDPVSGEKFKQAVLTIVDRASGGLKGIDLLTQLIEYRVIDPSNPEEIDLDWIADLVRGMVPEMDVLRYGMKLDEATDRVKYFFYRRLDRCCPKETV